jgi:hypothetical protein
MRVTASGNVGIGTPSPFTRLDVVHPNTQVRFGPSTGDYGGYLVSTNESQAIIAGGAKWDGANWITRGAFASLTAHQNGVIAFHTNDNRNLGFGSTFGPAERMRIALNGNVGIGTQNPVAGKLQVEDSSVGRAVYGISNVSGGGLSLGGIGILGETQTADGVGVYGKNLFGGFAMYAEGNTSQQRNKGGWVKALLKVSAAGGIERCYNAITGAAGGNCGFSPVLTADGRFDINFGFKVDDRFVSVTADACACYALVQVFYGFGNENTIRVVLYSGATYYNIPFTIIVY